MRGFRFVGVITNKIVGDNTNYEQEYRWCEYQRLVGDKTNNMHELVGENTNDIHPVSGAFITKNTNQLAFFEHPYEGIFTSRLRLLPILPPFPEFTLRHVSIKTRMPSVLHCNKSLVETTSKR